MKPSREHRKPRSAERRALPRCRPRWGELPDSALAASATWTRALSLWHYCSLTRPGNYLHPRRLNIMREANPHETAWKWHERKAAKSSQICGPGCQTIPLANPRHRLLVVLRHLALHEREAFASHEVLALEERPPYFRGGGEVWQDIAE